jgi:hypothetical protein
VPITGEELDCVVCAISKASLKSKIEGVRRFLRKKVAERMFEESDFKVILTTKVVTTS